MKFDIKRHQFQYEIRIFTIFMPNLKHYKSNHDAMKSSADGNASIVANVSEKLSNSMSLGNGGKSMNKLFMAFRDFSMLHFSFDCQFSQKKWNLCHNTAQ